MTTHRNLLSRNLILVYGVGAYLLFLVAFCGAIGFVGNLAAIKSIDSGLAGDTVVSMLINAGLLSLFVIQHTIMARPWFKERWTRIIPQAAERSTFVVATSLVLLLIFWQWRPVTTEVWRIENAVARGLVWGLFAGGWLLVLYSSILIDHFDLFGLRQVWLNFRDREHAHPGFAQPWLYRIIRNPLMLGFMIAFWSTPVMTAGHLQFAAMTTGYIFFGVWMEERDLSKLLGEDYRRYRKQTPMLVPRLRFARRQPVPASQEAMQSN